ncbi:MAG: glycosyltransferase family 9 protein [Quinella sp. 1Q7]|nr:glycosyltransferase family 9 protein [Quinella sp. 1Q7]
MATYFTAPAHERLNIFFGELFREMRKAPPQTHGQFLLRAEQEFQRLGYREKISAGVENILIVRIDAIGDMILMSGFLRELRRNFPQARITLVVSPLVYPIVEFCPYVNEVLAFNKNASRRNFVELMESIAIFCREHLWQKKFSAAFSPQCGGDNFPGILMAWLSGARERIGYDTEPYKNFFDTTPKKNNTLNALLLNRMLEPSKTLTFQTEKHFYVLTANGYKVAQNHMELFYGAADIQRADELLENLPADCKKIVLGLGAGDANRKYPVEKLVVALRELVKKNLVFVIVGGKSELDAANYIEKNLPPEKILNLVDKTTLRETEAVISRMDYYIGNDSGVMHIAAAAKIPVLAIYREAVDRQNVFPQYLSEFLNFPPWQTKSVVLRPAHQLDECATLPHCYGGCHHVEPHCIAQITPQEIVAGFERLQTL